MNTIKYRFASLNNKIVDILKLSQRPKDKLYCWGCKEEVVPVMGEKYQKHFRHKNTEYSGFNDSECSRESYLHQLGKVAFYQSYKKALEDKRPFNIIVDGNGAKYKCGCKVAPVFIDLAQYYPAIKQEAYIDGFIPDILLSDGDGNNVFIEIAVTHPCSKEKLASGYFIVEYRLKDESDLGTFLEKMDVFNWEQSRFNCLDPLRKCRLIYCSEQCEAIAKELKEELKAERAKELQEKERLKEVLQDRYRIQEIRDFWCKFHSEFQSIKWELSALKKEIDLQEQRRIQDLKAFWDEYHQAFQEIKSCFPAIKFWVWEGIKEGGLVYFKGDIDKSTGQPLSIYNVKRIDKFWITLVDKNGKHGIEEVYSFSECFTIRKKECQLKRVEVSSD